MRPTPKVPAWGWTKQAQDVLVTAALILSILLLARDRDVGPASRTFPALQVDPNTAPAQVLLALPRLGPARTAAIIEARRQAPLRSAADLDRRVRGVGPVTARGIAPFLRFPATTNAEGPPAP
jgi:competence protein ComEA